MWKEVVVPSIPLPPPGRALDDRSVRAAIESIRSQIDPGLWKTFVGDSGSASADSSIDQFSILGDNGISTSISGDVLTITIDTATDETLGIASFDSTDFTVTDGNVVIKDSGIDHDSLSNIPANDHIDHTTVTLTAGDGLTGGGDISANRSFAFDISDLATTDTTVGATDLVAIHDGAQKKITFANFESSLDHDNLSGVTANEHIDWTNTNSNFFTTGNLTVQGSCDVSESTFTIPNTLSFSASSGGHIGIDTVISGHTGLIKYHDGTEELTAIAIPTGNLTTTDGHLIKYNAGNDEFEMGTAGGTDENDWVLISSTIASSAATVDFTGLTDAYSAYMVVITNLLPATNAVEFWMRVETAGTTWHSGSTDYDFVFMGAATTPVGNRNTGAAQIELMDSTIFGTLSNSTGDETFWVVEVGDPSSASHYTNIIHRCSHYAPAVLFGSGRYLATTAVTGIRFLMSSGNIATGIFKLYGMVDA